MTVLWVRIMDAERMHRAVAALPAQLPDASADGFVRLVADVDALPPEQTGAGTGLLQPGIGLDRQQQPQTAVVMQPARRRQQIGQRQRVVMPGQVAGIAVGPPAVSKERWIADNAVITPFGWWRELLQGGGVQLQPCGPRAGGKIAGGILTGASVELDGVDMGVAALGQHQAEQTGAGADIEDLPAVGDRHIGAEQAGMGRDFHAGVALFDPELFELKPGIVFARAHAVLRSSRIVMVDGGPDQARQLRLCQSDNSRHTAA